MSLVTLTGVGGIGKTRLAAELALRIDWRRAESVAWVELAPCNDPLSVGHRAAAVDPTLSQDGGLTPS